MKKWIKNSEFDHLIHLAAIVPIKEVNTNKKKAFNVNTIGTNNLVETILEKKNNIKWVFLHPLRTFIRQLKKKLAKNQK